MRSRCRIPLLKPPTRFVTPASPTRASVASASSVAGPLAKPP
jgi:hypothetical protein